MNLARFGAKFGTCKVNIFYSILVGIKKACKSNYTALYMVRVYGPSKPGDLALELSYPRAWTFGGTRRGAHRRASCENVRKLTSCHTCTVHSVSHIGCSLSTIIAVVSHQGQTVAILAGTMDRCMKTPGNTGSHMESSSPKLR